MFFKEAICRSDLDKFRSKPLDFVFCSKRLSVYVSELSGTVRNLNETKPVCHHRDLVNSQTVRKGHNTYTAVIHIVNSCREIS